MAIHHLLSCSGRIDAAPRSSAAPTSAEVGAVQRPDAVVCIPQLGDSAGAVAGCWPQSIPDRPLRRLPHHHDRPPPPGEHGEGSAVNFTVVRSPPAAGCWLSTPPLPPLCRPQAAGLLELYLETQHSSLFLGAAYKRRGAYTLFQDRGDSNTSSPSYMGKVRDHPAATPLPSAVL